MTITAPPGSSPIIEANGSPTTQYRTFFKNIEEQSLILGEGSPEGVVEESQGREYADTNGSTGSIKYFKKLSDIGGDKTQGWELV